MHVYLLIDQSHKNYQSGEKNSLGLPCLSGGVILDMMPLMIGATIADPKLTMGTEERC